MTILSARGVILNKEYKYDSEILAQGGMKDVHLGQDKSFVIGFYRNKLDATGRSRINRIVTNYRKSIFESENGAYWLERFCWPTDIVEVGGRVGVVVPIYPSKFFFQFGSQKNDFLKIKGKEKQGKWFTTAKHRKMFLDPRELGDLRTNLKMLLELSRAVRKMHALGLAHSDLSYRNVLVDPITGSSCIIDIDGLVVPGIFPPDVVGTPDFIAPEVIASSRSGQREAGRILPSNSTDRHALAVLIYQYLLHRHPLKGKQTFVEDPVQDDALIMGEKALFIEHTSDKSNEVSTSSLSANEKPWGDPKQVPLSIYGPFLEPLFRRAFEAGLHAPQLRPSAADWEAALIKTLDLIQPCTNSACSEKWFVFDNSSSPRCPICSTSYTKPLPMLDLYVKNREGDFIPSGRRIMVWDGQSLFQYHIDQTITPNENLRPEHSKRVGYFQQISGKWAVVNENLETFVNATNKEPISKGGHVFLDDGLLLKFGNEDRHYLARVTLVNA